MSNRRCYLLPVQVLLVLALCLFQNAYSCKKVTRPIKKVFANPKVTEVSSHVCYTAESLRIHNGVPGYTNSAMGNELSVDSCKKFCKESGFEAKIVGLTPTECHCNKYLKYDGERDASKCAIRCRGNDQQFCGGIGYVSAYPS